MNVALWIAQALLALAFAAAGGMKAAMPIAELAQSLPWVTEAPALVRFIGVSELLGAVGVTLPAATRIKPQLTPIAAASLGLVMVLATGFHLVRGEYGVLPNVVLLALAGFVAWGRWRARPVTPRD